MLIQRPRLIVLDCLVDVPRLAEADDRRGNVRMAQHKADGSFLQREIDR